VLAITIAVLDLFLIYVVCQIIDLKNPKSLLIQGDERSSSSDCEEQQSSESSLDSEESDIQRQASFKRGMYEASHRDSFRMSGISYYECFKATSLWFTDIAVEIQDLAESSDESPGKTGAIPDLNETNQSNAQFESFASLNASERDDEDGFVY
jgi:hypothetical protein